MANTQFVSKTQLIILIKDIVREKKTGLISILTDTNRSVLLKFSEGRIIHSYSRSRDVGDVIQVLNESQSLKLTFAQIPAENAPELIPGEVLIQLLEAGSTESDTQPMAGNFGADSSAPNTARSNASMASVSAVLEELAAEYIGLVAEMIVEEALDSTSSTTEAIEYIAKMIPDEDDARQFVTLAKSAPELLSL